MKQANGTGSVYKLSGNRRKPYVARITTGTVYDSDNDKYIVKRKILGYYSTQQEARKVLAEFNENPCDPDKLDITISEIWDEVRPRMESNLSKSRMNSYVAAYNYLNPIQDRAIRTIKTKDLQILFDKCDKASSTKDNMKTILTKIYAYAMQNDYISKDYVKYVEYGKDAVKIQRTILTSQDVSQILSRASEWQYAMLGILLYTGMRINEFVSNRADNIDLENRTITIPRDIAKNESSARIVPICEQIYPLVKSFVNVGSEWLAVKPNGVKIRYQNFMDREMKEIQTYLGKNITPHDCRHTFITRAHECGLDNLVIQRIVGHAPETITEQVYTHLSIDELQKEMKKFKY